MRFDEKVVLITGAAHGMGACYARGFAKEGADVALVDIAQRIPAVDYQQGTLSELESVADELRKMGRNALAVVADVSKKDQVKAAVDRAIVTFGRIDILVNNAAIGIMGKPLIDYTEEEIDATFAVNLKGFILCCQEVIPYMARRKYGKIINIASGAALYAEPMMSIYATSKYGIRGLSEALAAEVSHYNINVNVVVPGFISTPGLRDILPKLFPEIDYETAYQGICNQNYFRREITEQDVTNAVLFLASDEARNITSQILAVTGAVEKKAPAKEPYFTV